MNIDKSKWLPAVVIIASLVCLLQLVRMIIFIIGLPRDWVAITLCAASVIIFAFIAVRFYIQWKRR